MAFGMSMSQSLLMKVKTKVFGEDKLNGLRKQLFGVDEAADKASSSMGEVGAQTDKAGNNADESAGQFGKMFGVGMNLMFMGMALSQVFGGLAGSMLKMTGASAAFGAAAKSTLLPFFLAITPLLIKVATLFIGLPKPIKMAIGTFVALLAVLGTFLFFGAQVALLAISLQVSLVSLAGAIFAVGAALLSIFVTLAAVVFFLREGKPLIAGLAALIGGAFTAALLKAAVSMNSVLAQAVVQASAYLASFAGTVLTAASSLLTYAGSAVAPAISATTSFGSTLIAYAAGALSSAIAGTISLASATWSLVAAYSSVLLPLAAVILSIIFLQRVFKKFGVVAGMIATVITSVLLAAFSPVAAVITAVVGAVMAINKAFKKWGNVIGTIVTIVVVAIAAIVGAFVSLPAAVAIALAAVIAWLWNMKEEIGAAINATIEFIVGIPDALVNMTNTFIKKAKSFVSTVGTWFKKAADKGLDKLGDLIDWFENLGSNITDAVGDIANTVKSVGEDIMEGIADGIRNAPDAIMDAIKDVAPDWVVETLNKSGEALKSGINKTKEAGSGFIAGTKDALNLNDFILTDDGRLMQPSPNDTIIGTKNPENLGGGGQTTVNINDPVMKEEADIERLVQEVEDRVNRNTRGRSTGTGIS